MVPDLSGKGETEGSKQMELRVLQYFLMVAEEENITKAAALLHVTQPTLSRQLKQLEDELGVKLFERSSHNIFLTKDGMLLKQRAQEMITLAEKTKQELQQANALSGEIALGSGESNGMYIVADIISGFRKRYPQIRFEIYTDSADGIKERFEHGLIDFAIFLEPVEPGKYNFIRMPQKDTWGVMMRNDHPLAQKGYVEPDDLREIPLLMPGRFLIQKEWASWFGGQMDNLNIVVTYNLLYNAALLVENGVGSALCLKLEAHYDNLTFVPVSPQLEMRSQMAWKKNQFLSPAASEFIKYAKDYMEEMKNNGESAIEHDCVSGSVSSFVQEKSDILE